MKHCDRCGKDYPDQTKFCPDCGLPFGEASKQEFTVHTDVPILETPPAAAPGGLDDEPLTAPWQSAPPPGLFIPPEPEAQPVTESQTTETVKETEPGTESKALEPPTPPKGQRERSADGALVRIGFGRVLLCVLISVLLFALLAASWSVFQVRRLSTPTSFEGLLGSLRVSAIPAAELGAETEDNTELASWLSDWLYEKLGEHFDYSTQELAEFLDRSSLREMTADTATLVVQDYYAGSGEHELSWYEYSTMLQANSGLYTDVFGLPMTPSEAGILAKQLVAGGFPTLPTVSALRASHPALAQLFHLGLSWVTLGILLAASLAVFLWLFRLGHSSVRSFRALGIVLTVLGALSTLAALLARLLPGVWRSMLGGVLLSSLSGEALWYTVLSDVIILAAGILLLVLSHVLRLLLAHRWAKRQEREQKHQERQRKRMERSGKVPAIYDD